MELVTLGLLTLVIILIIFIRRNDRGSFDSMPGPFRLPLFGNLQFNFPSLHKQFTEYSERYGEIFRIQILSQPAVVLNSYSIFKEAYSKRGKDIVGRPHKNLRFQTIGASNGVAFRTFSEKQQELRSRLSKNLALQGIQHLSNLVNENLDDLIAEFDKRNGEAFDPKDVIKKFLLNIMLTIVFGEKADYESELHDRILKFNKAAVEAATIGHEDVDVWSWTKFINPNYKLAVKAREAFDESLTPLYHKFKNTYVQGHERGAIDQYITEVLNGNLRDEDILGCLVDFFIGGVETTATSLYGFLVILLNSPEAQEKLQRELDDVIGQDRWPQITDKHSLPYAEACVLELFRYQSVLPLLVPREVIRDTQLAGYTIPKGTWVYTNAWAIHHNEDIYPDPFSYKPERFLDDNGNILPSDHITRKSLVTFGVGGRHCVGENLAKTRIFLSVCSFMQRFTFKKDESSPPPESDARNYNLKIVFDVSPYKLRAVRRV